MIVTMAARMQERTRSPAICSVTKRGRLAGDRDARVPFRCPSGGVDAGTRRRGGRIVAAGRAGLDRLDDDRGRDPRRRPVERPPSRTAGRPIGVGHDDERSPVLVARSTGASGVRPAEPVAEPIVATTAAASVARQPEDLVLVRRSRRGQQTRQEDGEQRHAGRRNRHREQDEPPSDPHSVLRAVRSPRHGRVCSRRGSPPASSSRRR